MAAGGRMTAALLRRGAARGAARRAYCAQPPPPPPPPGFGQPPPPPPLPPPPGAGDEGAEEGLIRATSAPPAAAAAAQAPAAHPGAPLPPGVSAEPEPPALHPVTGLPEMPLGGSDWLQRSGSPQVAYTGNPELQTQPKDTNYLLSGRLGTTGTTGNWKGGADLQDEAIIRTKPDGTNLIISKPSHPVIPRPHFEGSILDFSDGSVHPMQKNPFGDLAAEAREGKWGGVSPRAVAIPTTQSKAVYGFERRGLRSELLPNYSAVGRTGGTAGLIAPGDVDEGAQLAMAQDRMPEFDPLREAIWDKYLGRRWKEQRDMRLIEKESVWNRHNIQQFENELRLESARDVRKICVRDAVMQSPMKWLLLKYNKELAEGYRQHEDVKCAQWLEAWFWILFPCLPISFFITDYLDGGTLRVRTGWAAGCPSMIAGHCGLSARMGSYKEVGDMYRFNDKVARHLARLDGMKVNGIVEI